MSTGRWRRKLGVLAALGVCGVAAALGYQHFATTRALLDARLATLPSGRTVLVVQELVGFFGPSRQTVRFDFLDPTSGERLERTNAPLDLHAKKLRFLGGDARQWWGMDGEVVAVDAEKGTVTLGLLPADLPKVRDEPELPRLVSDSQHFTTRQRKATSNQPPGELARACYSMTEGPCTLGARSATEVWWQLGDAELDGNSVLAVEARDATRAYVYLANDGMFSMLVGGVWLYAIELDTGRVAWTKKL